VLFALTAVLGGLCSPVDVTTATVITAVVVFGLRAAKVALRRRYHRVPVLSPVPDWLNAGADGGAATSPGEVDHG
jgi:hypothetical protein